MKENNFYREIIKNRKKAVLAHIQTGKEFLKLERETALLALDILDAFDAKSFTIDEGYKCFVEIEAALNLKTRKRLSEEMRELLNEAIVLDETGTKYGPDLVFMRSLIAKILQRDEARSERQLKHLTSVFTSAQKRPKAAVPAV